MPAEPVIERVAAAIGEIANLSIHHDPPPSGPTTGQFLPVGEIPLHTELATELAREYPNGFFRHQGVAIRRILKGENTIVATQTSSGKSLIYSTPVFDALLRDDSATALFIYPQKALANDQFAKLKSTAGRLPSLVRLLTMRPHMISRYDGSTPQNQRNDIRNQVQVALTNPDMLHLGILQHHERQWARFFERLRYVIIDECHEYRGIFGTNVAYILRRLRQICSIHGSSPTFIATSATIRERESISRN